MRNKAKLIIRLALSATLLNLLLSSAAPAASGKLSGCFTPLDYDIHLHNHEIPASENIANHQLNDLVRVGQTGTPRTANCDCTSDIDTKGIYEKTFVGSPLVAGSPGYGYLTDNIDVDLLAYGDTTNDSGTVGIKIDEYPTPLASMKNTFASTRPTEREASVCRQNPDYPKRLFNWDKIAVTFYMKKPIFGLEIIPRTLVVQDYVCLSTSSSCNAPDSDLVTNIYLQGSLWAPLSCTINAGSTIEVDFGSLVPSQFATRGQPPAGVLKDVDINYHCDNDKDAAAGRIKMTLTADQGTVSGEPAIAKLIDREDLGIRVFNENNQNVLLDGTFEFPIVLDEQGNGSVKIKAAPVSTTDARPAAGSFEGNMTVKMEMK
ncbi:fimbrial protein [Salmonella enterica]|nr:fimbrial protein [Salmonella enterica]ELW2864819.1 fimbrial protein [Salmonella enterica]